VLYLCKVCKWNIRKPLKSTYQAFELDTASPDSFYHAVYRLHPLPLICFPCRREPPWRLPFTEQR
jgi:hypothetical protein